MDKHANFRECKGRARVVLVGLQLDGGQAQRAQARAAVLLHVRARHGFEVLIERVARVQALIDDRVRALSSGRAFPSLGSQPSGQTHLSSKVLQVVAYPASPAPADSVECVRQGIENLTRRRAY